MSRASIDRLSCGASWSPAQAPAVYSIALSGGRTATKRIWPATEPARRVSVLDRLPTSQAPGVVSLPIPVALPRVRSFVFSAPPDSLALENPREADLNHASVRADAADRSNRFLPGSQAAQESVGGSRPATSTRIQPPADVIKLEDRLFYALQPSLESILATSSLRFPFHPFAFQLEGVAFLYPRHEAVLADEMGLGKTMQAITSVRLLVHSGQVRRVLLVCPKPLVTNWQREFALWAPEIPLAVVEGSRARRLWQWSRTEAVVTVANYELLLRDQEDIQQADVAFDLVVLDEAQRIKNRRGATSQAVRSIVRDRSWALTGTPVENSAEDLVGVFDFVAPGLLRSDMKPRRMGRAVADHFLRRTKDQVLRDLPPVLCRDAEIDLSPEQWTTYQTAEEDGVVRLSEMGESLTIQHVFELILRLKQICNFDPATGASSKLERLEADLAECAESGRKAIVFSQWVQTLTELRKRLARFGPLEYHGRVPPRRRDAVIERFRADPRRRLLLMSYGAGSVGLNLQFASYVFLFDRWWNPAVEDQAINRAHRIGVSHPVTVTRFTALGTIEERIQRILAEKRDLFDTIFSDTRRAKSFGLTQQEILSLFNLQTPEGPLRRVA